MAEKFTQEFKVQKCDITDITINSDDIHSSERTVWVKYHHPENPDKYNTKFFVLRNPQISECKEFLEESIVERDYPNLVIGKAKTHIKESQQINLSKKKIRTDVIRDMLERKSAPMKLEFTKKMHSW